MFWWETVTERLARWWSGLRGSLAAATDRVRAWSPPPALRPFLSHLVISPLLVLARLTSAWVPGALWWVSAAAWILFASGLVWAWARSSAIVGSSLVRRPRLPLPAWAAVWEWLREATRLRDRTERIYDENAVGCLVLVGLLLLVLFAAVCHSLVLALWSRPMLLAAVVQATDLLVLVSAIARALADERRSAVEAVERYYHAQQAFLETAFPLPRFRAELRVRIPGAATVDQAWQAARDFIVELQKAVLLQQTRARHHPQSRGVNPGGGAGPSLSNI